MKAIIVDDEYYSARYLEMICKNIGDLSIEGIFENAIQALEFIRNNNIQLVFMDIEMPGLTGMEAVQEIRCIQPEMGVVFITSYEQYALDAFRADAVDYIMKPCNEEDIKNAVKKALKILPSHRKRVEVRTFGAFCVLIDGHPIRFSNSKAEELLALLIDREGAVVTMEQAVDVLWGERPYDEMVKRLYRKAVGYLKKVFEDKKVGFFVAERGCCHIEPKEIDCDYYSLLAGEEDVISRYYGVYMSQFSWSEFTVGRIDNFIKNR